MQAKLIKIRIAAQTYPCSAGLKTVLAHFSGDYSWRPVRAPLLTLDDNQKTDLIKLYGSAGHTPPPLG